MPIETAFRTTDLIAKFGVDTHLGYTDGGYARIDQDLKALAYLGIDHLRDAAPNPAYDPFGQKHYGDAANAGMSFVFSAQGTVDPVIVVQRLHAFLKAHPGSITGIEGPNEVNNFPVAYYGKTGLAGAQAYQKALFDAVNADPLLKDIPILGFVDSPAHASASDWNNIHPYSKMGDQPRASIVAEASQQNAVDPGKPFAMTETGYHTSLSADTAGGWEGVDEATQAKLVLNTYMDGADLGARETYLYQLLDAYPDPQGSDQEKHFGLFRLDGSAKPAATAIHNLTTILHDGGSTAASFKTGSLDYSVSGLPASGHTFLTEKSDGSFDIIAWNEPDIWDQNADRSIAAPQVPTILQFGQTFATVQVFDPLLGTEAVQTFHNVSSVTLGVTDHPLVVHVVDGHGAADADPSPAPLPHPTPAPALPAPAPVEPIPPTPAPDPSPAGEGLHVTGGPGNDTLIGGAHDDTIAGYGGKDYIDGGPGADVMIGGTGDDTYVVDNVGDRIIEAYGEGWDFVRSSISFKLDASLNDLTLTGSANIDGVGNSLANTITGNAGSNVLTGGKAGDTFVFNTAFGPSNVDHITDFQPASDSIRLTVGVVPGIASGHLLASAFKDVASSAVDADDRILYDHNTGALSYDVDGSGPHAAVKFAVIDNHAVLTAHDFFIV